MGGGGGGLIPSAEAGTAGKGRGDLEGRTPTKGDGATQLQTTREWQAGPGTASCFLRGTRNTDFECGMRW